MQITVSALNSVKNITNLVSNKRSQNSPQLANDTFIRTCSFGNSTKEDDKSYEKFRQWSDEVGFLDFAQEIISSTGRIIGSGFEAKTYAIPHNDQWVIKQSKRAGLINVFTPEAQILEIKDIAPDLNIGQYIATVKIPLNDRFTQQFYILKKQTGESFGVPYSARNDVNDTTAKVHLNSLKKLSELPQESFDKLVSDIQYVTRKGYKFDVANPCNFMIDSTKKSVNFVGIENKIGMENNTQYGDVLFALLDGEFGVEFNKSDRPQNEKEEAAILSQKICSKFMISMIRKNVQFTFTDKFEDVFNSRAFEAIMGTSNQDEKVDKMIELGLC